MTAIREDLAQAIIEAGRLFYSKGWSPATSSNYSACLTSVEVLLAASGKHKGQLTADDLLAVDMNGPGLELGRNPSAETLLHTQLYRWKSGIGAVLHTRSVNATVLSRICHSDSLVLVDYELQKAFRGGSSHESQVLVPMFENDQDIGRLAAQVQAWLNEHPDCAGYLIRGTASTPGAPRM